MNLFPAYKRSPLVSSETFAICLLMTCSLQIMGGLLPRIPIFPWLRIGLAYWIILPFLIRFGVAQVLVLFLFRNLMTMIYGGQLFSSFLISTSAGFVSLAVFGALGRYLYRHKKINLYGLSIMTAGSFNIIQLVVACQLIVQHQDFYFQVAPILVWSLASGWFIAFVVSRSQETLDSLFSRTYSLSPPALGTGKIQLFSMDAAGLLASVAVFISIFVFRSPWVQLGTSVCLVLIIKPENTKTLLYAWPFYFYISWLHLFRTDGVYIIGEWITQEGLDAFIYYTLRTTNVILCGQWLARYVPAVIRNLQRNRYLEGACFALPILPSIFGISIALGKELFGKIKKRDFENLLEPILDRLQIEFVRLSDNQSYQPG